MIPTSVQKSQNPLAPCGLNDKSLTECHITLTVGRDKQEFEDMEQPLVSIVIATYNRASSLRSHFFPAIANLTYLNYELIVIDDYSTDDTQSFLQSCKDQIKNLLVFQNARNRGACFSRNFGIAHAKGKIIVLMDDDVSLFPNSLDELVKFYADNPDVMVAWGCVYQYGGCWEEGTATFGTGSLWSLRAEVFQHFRFDTNLRYFGTTACDEHDLARRIQKQGFNIVDAKNVQANHFHAPAKNRNWRGIGGDLNYLYEKLKSGSILEYYAYFILGIVLLFKRFVKNEELEKYVNEHPYKNMLNIPHRILVLIKQRQFLIAIQCLFYTMIDIPLRAKTKEIIERIARTYSPNWPA